MGILRVDHPDILDFVAVKLDASRMRNFNLSVAVTDRFMSAAIAGGRYPLINPRTGEVVRELEARAVLDLIARAAWTSGDPGVVFIDRIEASNPTPALGAIEATNPCGEQPLLPFEACTLGSVNLGRFVRDRGDGAGASIDWERLAGCIHDAVRFLDDVVEVNQYPLPAIADATRATRKIGLGVMGLADLFIDLDVPYDDERALAIGAEIAAFFERESLAASTALGAERGAFPAFAGSRWDLAGHAPLRNATTTTVAPTGTISIIAGCSSGIEPLYAIAYDRHVLDGAILPELHPGFARRAAALGLLDDDLVATLRVRGRVRGLATIPADLQALFVTAHDVPVEHHVRMQAAFQRHVHAAVSKTINLPNDATPDDVRGAYLLAYAAGCKGITVYRDGSRAMQVLAFGDTGAAPPPPEGCPACGGELRDGGRCRVCLSCAWSACG
jgi:ribonucleoside-diphosphate reductase alpha chain